MLRKFKKKKPSCPILENPYYVVSHMSCKIWKTLLQKSFLAMHTANFASQPLSI